MNAVHIYSGQVSCMALSWSTSHIIGIKYLCWC